jgi:1-deoxy-D-xylulose-5-phosphate synthase
VVSVEDSVRVGGCGATLAQALTDAWVETPVRVHGIPQEFLQHAKRAAILDRIGLSAADLLRSVADDLARVDAGRRLREVPRPRAPETA